MNSVHSHALDLSFFSPADWPDYSISKLRVGWIREHSTISEPAYLNTLRESSVFKIQTCDWSEATKDPIRLAYFFDQIEVVLMFSQCNVDPNVMAVAAAMGRAVVTDNRTLFPFNHGETGLVVCSDPSNIAQTLILLKKDRGLRQALGRNLRRKYFELRQRTI